jgi:hypothetical protein
VNWAVVSAFTIGLSLEVPLAGAGADAGAAPFAYSTPPVEAHPWIASVAINIAAANGHLKAFTALSPEVTPVCAGIHAMAAARRCQRNFSY